MSDLEAVYRAAVEAAPECLDGDFASVERMVDAALAALAGNGYFIYRLDPNRRGKLYVRKGSDGATRTSQYVEVWSNE